jgi:beta-N-acetylhexosaminidase
MIRFPGRFLFALLLLSLLLLGQSKSSPGKSSGAKSKAGKTIAPKASKVAAKSSKKASPAPEAAVDASLIHFPRNTPNEVRLSLRKLSLREMVAQLVIIPIYGDNPARGRREFQEYTRLVQQRGVGGLILLNRVVAGQVRKAEPFALAAFLNRMQKESKYPLIVGGDFERGASMRVMNTTIFPHAMAYGAANDLEATRRTGAATAREARALGVHWVFAPDADVNNNRDNPIINTRSYGADPQLVAAHVKAFIEGAHEARKDGVLVTVKHFPGHGDTATDTHIGLARVNVDRARLDAVELVPFQAAIASNVDGIMTSHVSVPAVEDQEIPATVSQKVITGLLRKELGFEGLVVTDAMDMQGLTKQFSPGEASVRALEAGVDVLLIPTNADAAIKGVMDALASGRLRPERIHQSVVKLWTAKHRLGLFQQRLVNVEEISEQIDSPAYAELALRVAEKALATIKNESGVLPLRDPANTCLVVLAEARNSNSGRRMTDEMLARTPKMKTLLLDPQLKGADLLETVTQLDACGSVVLATFVTATSFRGDVALPANYVAFLDALLAKSKPVILCALGSPYILPRFPAAAAQIATFSTTVTSEIALVRGLYGEVPMTAKAPVAIQ